MPPCSHLYITYTVKGTAQMTATFIPYLIFGLNTLLVLWKVQSWVHTNWILAKQMSVRLTFSPCIQLCETLLKGFFTHPKILFSKFIEGHSQIIGQMGLISPPGAGWKVQPKTQKTYRRGGPLSAPPSPPNLQGMAYLVANSNRNNKTETSNKKKMGECCILKWTQKDVVMKESKSLEE